MKDSIASHKVVSFMVVMSGYVTIVVSLFPDIMDDDAKRGG